MLPELAFDFGFIQESEFRDLLSAISRIIRSASTIQPLAILAARYFTLIFVYTAIITLILQCLEISFKVFPNNSTWLQSKIHPVYFS